MNISLRPAAQADADAVADVYLASRNTFVAYAPLAHTEAQVRQWIAAVLVPSGGVVVAESGNKIVGMAATAQEGAQAWLEHLYVAPGSTAQGIGGRLLAHVQAQMGPSLRLYVFQANTDARRFYERHGFRLLGLSDGQDNEEHCPDALYEWAGESDN